MSIRRSYSVGQARTNVHPLWKKTRSWSPRCCMEETAANFRRDGHLGRFPEPRDGDFPPMMGARGPCSPRPPESSDLDSSGNAEVNWETIEIRFLQCQDSPASNTSRGRGRFREHRASPQQESDESMNGMNQNSASTPRELVLCKQTVRLEKVKVRNLLDSNREVYGDLNTSRKSEYVPKAEAVPVAVSSITGSQVSGPFVPRTNQSPDDSTRDSSDISSLCRDTFRIPDRSIDIETKRQTPIAGALEHENIGHVPHPAVKGVSGPEKDRDNPSDERSDNVSFLDYSFTLSSSRYSRNEGSNPDVVPQTLEGKEENTEDGNTEGNEEGEELDGKEQPSNSTYCLPKDVIDEYKQTAIDILQQRKLHNIKRMEKESETSLKHARTGNSPAVAPERDGRSPCQKPYSGKEDRFNIQRANNTLSLRSPNKASSPRGFRNKKGPAAKIITNSPKTRQSTPVRRSSPSPATLVHPGKWSTRRESPTQSKPPSKRGTSPQSVKQLKRESPNSELLRQLRKAMTSEKSKIYETIGRPKSGMPGSSSKSSHNRMACEDADARIKTPSDSGAEGHFYDNHEIAKALAFQSMLNKFSAGAAQDSKGFTDRLQDRPVPKNRALVDEETRHQATRSRSSSSKFGRTILGRHVQRLNSFEPPSTTAQGRLSVDVDVLPRDDDTPTRAYHNLELMEGILKSPTAKAVQALGRFYEASQHKTAKSRVEDVDISVNQILNQYRDIFRRNDVPSPTVAEMRQEEEYGSQAFADKVAELQHADNKGGIRGSPRSSSPWATEEYESFSFGSKPWSQFIKLEKNKPCSVETRRPGKEGGGFARMIKNKGNLALTASAVDKQKPFASTTKWDFVSKPPLIRDKRACWSSSSLDNSTRPSSRSATPKSSYHQATGRLKTGTVCTSEPNLAVPGQSGLFTFSSLGASTRLSSTNLFAETAASNRSPRTDYTPYWFHPTTICDRRTACSSSSSLESSSILPRGKVTPKPSPSKQVLRIHSCPSQEESMASDDKDRGAGTSSSLEGNFVHKTPSSVQLPRLNRLSQSLRSIASKERPKLNPSSTSVEYPKNTRPTQKGASPSSSQSQYIRRNDNRCKKTPCNINRYNKPMPSLQSKLLSSHESQFRSLPSSTEEDNSYSLPSNGKMRKPPSESTTHWSTNSACETLKNFSLSRMLQKTLSLPSGMEAPPNFSPGNSKVKPTSSKRALGPKPYPNPSKATKLSKKQLACFSLSCMENCSTVSDRRGIPPKATKSAPTFNSVTPKASSSHLLRSLQNQTSDIDWSTVPESSAAFSRETSEGIPYLRIEEHGSDKDLNGEKLEETFAYGGTVSEASKSASQGYCPKSRECDKKQADHVFHQDTANRYDTPLTLIQVQVPSLLTENVSGIEIEDGVSSILNWGGRRFEISKIKETYLGHCKAPPNHQLTRTHPSAMADPKDTPKTENVETNDGPSLACNESDTENVEGMSDSFSEGANEDLSSFSLLPQVDKTSPDTPESVGNEPVNQRQSMGSLSKPHLNELDSNDAKETDESYVPSSSNSHFLHPKLEDTGEKGMACPSPKRRKMTSAPNSKKALEKAANAYLSLNMDSTDADVCKRRDFPRRHSSMPRLRNQALETPPRSLSMPETTTPLSLENSIKLELPETATLSQTDSKKCDHNTATITLDTDASETSIEGSSKSTSGVISKVVRKTCLAISQGKRQRHHGATANDTAAESKGNPVASISAHELSLQCEISSDYSEWNEPNVKAEMTEIVESASITASNTVSKRDTSQRYTTVTSSNKTVTTETTREGSEDVEAAKKWQEMRSFLDDGAELPPDKDLKLELGFEKGRQSFQSGERVFDSRLELYPRVTNTDQGEGILQSQALRGGRLMNNFDDHLVTCHHEVDISSTETFASLKRHLLHKISNNEVERVDLPDTSRRMIERHHDFYVENFTANVLEQERFLQLPFNATHFKFLSKVSICTHLLPKAEMSLKITLTGNEEFYGKDRNDIGISREGDKERRCVQRMLPIEAEEKHIEKKDTYAVPEVANCIRFQASGSNCVQTKQLKTPTSEEEAGETSKRTKCTTCLKKYNEGAEGIAESASERLPQVIDSSGCFIIDPIVERHLMSHQFRCGFRKINFVHPLNGIMPPLLLPTPDYLPSWPVNPDSDDDYGGEENNYCDAQSRPDGVDFDHGAQPEVIIITVEEGNDLPFYILSSPMQFIFLNSDQGMLEMPMPHCPNMWHGSVYPQETTGITSHDKQSYSSCSRDEGDIRCHCARAHSQDVPYCDDFEIISVLPENCFDYRIAASCKSLHSSDTSEDSTVWEKDSEAFKDSDEGTSINNQQCLFVSDQTIQSQNSIRKESGKLSTRQCQKTQHDSALSNETMRISTRDSCKICCKYCHCGKVNCECCIPFTLKTNSLDSMDKKYFGIHDEASCHPNRKTLAEETDYKFQNEHLDGSSYNVANVEDHVSCFQTATMSDVNLAHGGQDDSRITRLSTTQTRLENMPVDITHFLSCDEYEVSLAAAIKFLENNDHDANPPSSMCENPEKNLHFMPDTFAFTIIDGEENSPDSDNSDTASSRCNFPSQNKLSDVHGSSQERGREEGGLTLSLGNENTQTIDSKVAHNTATPCEELDGINTQHEQCEIVSSANLDQEKFTRALPVHLIVPSQSKSSDVKDQLSPLSETESSHQFSDATTSKYTQSQYGTDAPLGKADTRNPCKNKNVMRKKMKSYAELAGLKATHTVRSADVRVCAPSKLLSENISKTQRVKGQAVCKPLVCACGTALDKKETNDLHVKNGSSTGTPKLRKSEVRPCEIRPANVPESYPALPCRRKGAGGGSCRRSSSASHIEDRFKDVNELTMRERYNADHATKGVSPKMKCFFRNLSSPPHRRSDEPRVPVVYNSSFSETVNGRQRCRDERKNSEVDGGSGTERLSNDHTAKRRHLPFECICKREHLYEYIEMDSISVRGAAEPDRTKDYCGKSHSKHNPRRCRGKRPSNEDHRCPCLHHHGNLEPGNASGSPNTMQTLDPFSKKRVKFLNSRNSTSGREKESGAHTSVQKPHQLYKTTSRKHERNQLMKHNKRIILDNTGTFGKDIISDKKTRNIDLSTRLKTLVHPSQRACHKSMRHIQKSRNEDRGCLYTDTIPQKCNFTCRGKTRKSGSTKTCCPLCREQDGKNLIRLYHGRSEEKLRNSYTEMAESTDCGSCSDTCGDIGSLVTEVVNSSSSLIKSIQHGERTIKRQTRPAPHFSGEHEEVARSRNDSMESEGKGLKTLLASCLVTALESVLKRRSVWQRGPNRSTHLKRLANNPPSRQKHLSRTDPDAYNYTSGVGWDTNTLAQVSPLPADDRSKRSISISEDEKTNHKGKYTIDAFESIALSTTNAINHVQLHNLPQCSESDINITHHKSLSDDELTPNDGNRPYHKCCKSDADILHITLPVVGKSSHVTNTHQSSKQDSKGECESLTLNLVSTPSSNGSIDTFLSSRDTCRDMAPNKPEHPFAMEEGNESPRCKQTCRCSLSEGNLCLGHQPTFTPLTEDEPRHTDRNLPHSLNSVDIPTADEIFNWKWSPQPLQARFVDLSSALQVPFSSWKNSLGEDIGKTHEATPDQSESVPQESGTTCDSKMTESKEPDHNSSQANSNVLECCTASIQRTGVEQTPIDGFDNILHERPLNEQDGFTEVDTNPSKDNAMFKTEEVPSIVDAEKKSISTSTDSILRYQNVETVSEKATKSINIGGRDRCLLSNRTDANDKAGESLQLQELKTANILEEPRENSSPENVRDEQKITPLSTSHSEEMPTKGSQLSGKSAAAAVSECDNAKDDLSFDTQVCFKRKDWDIGVIFTALNNECHSECNASTVEKQSFTSREVHNEDGGGLSDREKEHIHELEDPTDLKTKDDKNRKHATTYHALSENLQRENTQTTHDKRLCKSLSSLHTESNIVLMLNNEKQLVDEECCPTLTYVSRDTDLDLNDISNALQVTPEFEKQPSSRRSLKSARVIKDTLNQKRRRCCQPLTPDFSKASLTSGHSRERTMTLYCCCNSPTLTQGNGEQTIIDDCWDPSSAHGMSELKLKDVSREQWLRQEQCNQKAKEQKSIIEEISHPPTVAGTREHSMSSNGQRITLGSAENHPLVGGISILPWTVKRQDVPVTKNSQEYQGVKHIPRHRRASQGSDKDAVILENIYHSRTLTHGSGEIATTQGGSQHSMTPENDGKAEESQHSITPENDEKTIGSHYSMTHGNEEEIIGSQHSMTIERDEKTIGNQYSMAHGNNERAMTHIEREPSKTHKCDENATTQRGSLHSTIHENNVQTIVSHHTMAHEKNEKTIQSQHSVTHGNDEKTIGSQHSMTHGNDEDAMGSQYSMRLGNNERAITHIECEHSKTYRCDENATAQGGSLNLTIPEKNEQTLRSEHSMGCENNEKPIGSHHSLTHENNEKTSGCQHSITSRINEMTIGSQHSITLEDDEKTTGNQLSINGSQNSMTLENNEKTAGIYHGMVLENYEKYMTHIKSQHSKACEKNGGAIQPTESEHLMKQDNGQNEIAPVAIEQSIAHENYGKYVIRSFHSMTQNLYENTALLENNQHSMTYQDLTNVMLLESFPYSMTHEDIENSMPQESSQHSLTHADIENSMPQESSQHSLTNADIKNSMPQERSQHSMTNGDIKNSMPQESSQHSLAHVDIENSMPQEISQHSLTHNYFHYTMLLESSQHSMTHGGIRNTTLLESGPHSKTHRDFKNTVTQEGSQHSMTLEEFKSTTLPESSQHSITPEEFKNSIEAESSQNSIILGDFQSTLLDESSQNSTIFGDFQNTMADEVSQNSFILGGFKNTMADESSQNSIILGDFQSTLTDESSQHSITHENVQNAMVDIRCQHSVTYGEVENSMRPESHQRSIGHGNCENAVVHDNSGHSMTRGKNEAATVKDNSQHSMVQDGSHRSMKENSHRSMKENSHRSMIENSHRSTVENSHRSTVENSHRSTVENSHRSTVENSHRSTIEYRNRSMIENSHLSMIENSHRSTVENSHRSTVENSHRSTIENSHRSTIENSHCSLKEGSSHRMVPEARHDSIAQECTHHTTIGEGIHDSMQDNDIYSYSKDDARMKTAKSVSNDYWKSRRCHDTWLALESSGSSTTKENSGVLARQNCPMLSIDHENRGGERIPSVSREHNDMCIRKENITFLMKVEPGNPSMTKDSAEKAMPNGSVNRRGQMISHFSPSPESPDQFSETEGHEMSLTQGINKKIRPGELTELSLRQERDQELAALSRRRTETPALVQSMPSKIPKLEDQRQADKHELLTSKMRGVPMKLGNEGPIRDHNPEQPIASGTNTPRGTWLPVVTTKALSEESPTLTAVKEHGMTRINDRQVTALSLHGLRFAQRPSTTELWHAQSAEQQPYRLPPGSQESPKPPSANEYGGVPLGQRIEKQTVDGPERQMICVITPGGEEEMGEQANFTLKEMNQANATLKGNLMIPENDQHSSHYNHVMWPRSEHPVAQSRTGLQQRLRENLDGPNFLVERGNDRSDKENFAELPEKLEKHEQQLFELGQVKSRSFDYPNLYLKRPSLNRPYGNSTVLPPLHRCRSEHGKSEMSSFKEIRERDQLAFSPELRHYRQEERCIDPLPHQERARQSRTETNSRTMETDVKSDDKRPRIRDFFSQVPFTRASQEGLTREKIKDPSSVESIEFPTLDDSLQGQLALWQEPVKIPASPSTVFAGSDCVDEPPFIVDTFEHLPSSSRTLLEFVEQNNAPSREYRQSPVSNAGNTSMSFQRRVNQSVTHIDQPPLGEERQTSGKEDTLGSVHANEKLKDASSLSSLAHPTTTESPFMPDVVVVDGLDTSLKDPRTHHELMTYEPLGLRMNNLSSREKHKLSEEFHHTPCNAIKVAVPSTLSLERKEAMQRNRKDSLRQIRRQVGFQYRYHPFRNETRPCQRSRMKQPKHNNNNMPPVNALSEMASIIQSSYARRTSIQQDNQTNTLSPLLLERHDRSCHSKDAPLGNQAFMSHGKCAFGLHTKTEGLLKDSPCAARLIEISLEPNLSSQRREEENFFVPNCSLEENRVLPSMEEMKEARDGRRITNTVNAPASKRVGQGGEDSDPTTICRDMDLHSRQTCSKDSRYNNCAYSQVLDDSKQEKESTAKSQNENIELDNHGIGLPLKHSAKHPKITSISSNLHPQRKEVDGEGVGANDKAVTPHDNAKLSESLSVSASHDVSVRSRLHVASGTNSWSQPTSHNNAKARQSGHSNNQKSTSSWSVDSSLRSDGGQPSLPVQMEEGSLRDIVHNLMASEPRPVEIAVDVYPLPSREGGQGHGSKEDDGGHVRKLAAISGPLMNLNVPVVHLGGKRHQSNKAALGSSPSTPKSGQTSSEHQHQSKGASSSAAELHAAGCSRSPTRRRVLFQDYSKAPGVTIIHKSQGETVLRRGRLPRATGPKDEGGDVSTTQAQAQAQDFSNTTVSPPQRLRSISSFKSKMKKVKKMLRFH